MIEEEQRKMQESILSLLHRKERERQEKMSNPVPEKSQLEKDIEQISIDKEVEKKVREDLGQNEHEKKRIQVPICNYGPSCKCNPVLPDDIFDQLEAGKEPGVEENSKSEDKVKEETSAIKTENNVAKEEPKRRKKRRNFRTAFEYNLKVDFHDANSNFYQLLSSEDEDDVQTGEDNDEESSEESFVEMQATLEEIIDNKDDKMESEEEDENSFISEYSDGKERYNNESANEKGNTESELCKADSFEDNSSQRATQNCDDEDVIIVEDIVEFVSDDIDTKLTFAVEKVEEITNVTPMKASSEKKDSTKYEENYIEEVEPGHTKSMNLGHQSIQSNEDITHNITQDQNHEPLQSILKTKCDRAEEIEEEKTEKILSIPVSTDKEELVMPAFDSQIGNLEATIGKTEQEQDDVKTLLLKATSNSPREEHQENTKDRKEIDLGGQVKSKEVAECSQERDNGVLMGKKRSRSKRRKTRVKSADLKLSSKQINCDKDGRKERLVLNERSMVKLVKDVGECTENKIKFPRSNCRDIMSLLQQENSDDLNLYPDWKRRKDRGDFPMSKVDRGHEKPLPLPPISQALRKRADNTESVTMAPDWTRAPVADIILR